MRFEAASLGFVWSAVFIVACSSNGSPADGGNAGRDGAAGDVDAASGGSDADTNQVDGGAPGATFLPFDPCNSASDYDAPEGNNIRIVTVPSLAYSPKCLRLQGQGAVVVNFEGSPEHPVRVSNELTATNGVPVFSDPAGFTFNTRPAFGGGFYAFECVNHTSAGMKGVVWIDPR